MIKKRCLEEIKERERRGVVRSKWKEGRREFFEERGIRILEMEEGRKAGSEWFKKLEERDKGKQKRGRWERIGKSRYNRWYKVIMGEEVPEYLRKKWGESRWRRVVRFRLGNEIREGTY